MNPSIYNPSISYLEQRVEQFKNDPFIKYALDKILMYNTYAQPVWNGYKIDIDNYSKKMIKYWQDNIEEHKKLHYWDIFEKVENE